MMCSEAHVTIALKEATCFLIDRSYSIRYSCTIFTILYVMAGGTCKAPVTGWSKYVPDRPSCGARTTEGISRLTAL